MRLLSTRTMQMMISTRIMTEDGAKHKNNTNESAKHKNKANEVPKDKNDVK